MNRKVYCACCARQIVTYQVSDEHIIDYRGCKSHFGNEVICRECGEDLDENGNFPEEYK